MIIRMQIRDDYSFYFLSLLTFLSFLVVAGDAARKREMKTERERVRIKPNANI